MSVQQSTSKFSCAACNHTYSWKPELAGKRVKCKCGAPVSVPAAQAPPPPTVAPAPVPVTASDGEDDSDLDGLYALADDAKRASAKKSVSSIGAPCPGCGVAMQPGSVICVECGHDLRTGRQVAASSAGGRSVMPVSAQPAAVLPYGGGRSAEQVAADRNTDVYFEGGKARALYLPTGFILIGSLFYLWQAVAFGRNTVSGTGVFIAIVGIRVIFDSIMTFIAMLAAAKFLDMGFGAVGPAILKLFALTLGPAAVGGLVEQAIGPGAGGALVGGAVTVILYFAVIKLLFELDFSESLQFVGILYVVRRWVGTFIFLFFMTMVFPSIGMPRGGTAVLSGSAGSTSGDVVNERKQREAVADKLLKGDQMEANAFFAVHPQRTLFRRTPEESRAAVKALYEMGAKNVIVASINKEAKPAPFALYLVVELPSDAASRKKLLDWHEDAELAVLDSTSRLPAAAPPTKPDPEDTEDVSDIQDVGQRHFTVNFFPESERN